MRCRRCRAAVLLALALGWGSAAHAQGFWGVQTVALRDYREARGVAAGLALHGLPAYTEFAMQNGLQFVRVRVGCVDDREVADAWAELLVRSLVAEAVVVLLDEPPPAEVACVAAEVGFRTSVPWSLVSAPGDVPVFEVAVAGHRAYLEFDGGAWRIWQGVAPTAVAAAPARVVATQVAGHDVVRTLDGDLLCPGRLLVAVGDAAVVALGDAVVGCRPAAGEGP